MRTRIGRGRVADRGRLMASAPTYNPGVADRFQRACGGRRWALFVAVVLIAGLGLRMGHAIRAPNEPVYDARAYARIAHSVYAGEGFTQGPEAGRLHLQAATNYTPGLPLLVAGLYEVRGAADQKMARIVLALLSSLAIPLAFFLGRRLGGPPRRATAAVPVAVYPALLEDSGMLMNEPLGTALLAAAVLAFLGAAESSKPWSWAGAGLLLGALAMLRPGYLLPIPARLSVLCLRRAET